VRLLQINRKARFGEADALCSISEASNRADLSQQQAVSTRMPYCCRLSNWQCVSN